MAMGALVAACDQQPVTGWPTVANRIGPYGELLTESDVTAAAADNFNLTLLSASPLPLRTALAAHGVRYLDPKPWSYIRKRCALQFATEAAQGAPRSCALTAEDAAVILDEVSARLAEFENDPDLAGYWVLDDYPSGDIRATLRAIHALVAQSNQRTLIKRPVVCGVGGFLDRREQATDPFTAEHSYTEESLVNVSPDTCDVVAPYFYGVANADDPQLVDWSMQSLMPWFIEALQTRGYTQPTLLPVVQAFAAPATLGQVYIAPRPADMSAQASAYCGSGSAVALLFFTWSGPGLTRTYANDADLRLGVRTATNTCRNMGLDLPAPGGSG